MSAVQWCAAQMYQIIANHNGLRNNWPGAPLSFISRLRLRFRLHSFRLLRRMRKTTFQVSNRKLKTPNYNFEVEVVLYFKSKQFLSCGFTPKFSLNKQNFYMKVFHLLLGLLEVSLSFFLVGYDVEIKKKEFFNAVRNSFL